MIRILLSTRLGERRWTQADLARATGIRPSTINDYYTYGGIVEGRFEENYVEDNDDE